MAVGRGRTGVGVVCLACGRQQRLGTSKALVAIRRCTASSPPPSPLGSLALPAQVFDLSDEQKIEGAHELRLEELRIRMVGTARYCSMCGTPAWQCCSPALLAGTAHWLMSGCWWG